MILQPSQPTDREHLFDRSLQAEQLRNGAPSQSSENFAKPHAGLHVEPGELAAQEKIIEKGWETFIAVGRALAQIRDKKLYRAQHATFESYCRERWQFARSHAYRLIGAAELAECISTDSTLPSPSNEAQLRPLIGLEPNLAKKIWMKAVEDAGEGKVTAKLVKAAAESIRPGVPRKAPVASTLRGTPLGDKAAELANRLEEAILIKIQKRELFQLLKDASSFIRDLIPAEPLPCGGKPKKPC